jgi:hypothetical protein
MAGIAAIGSDRGLLGLGSNDEKGKAFGAVASDEPER